MGEQKLMITLYLGEPMYFDRNTPINEILKQCGIHRSISVNSRKAFMLVELSAGQDKPNDHYFIPTNQPLETTSECESIYYRYVDYHTDRDCLYYIDNQCFEYVYHQYKHDARVQQSDHSHETLDSLKSEIAAMEILIMAMIFGEPQKPQKFIKHYKDLTDYPIVDTDWKETKNLLVKNLKNMKGIRTEYECMEKYLLFIDENFRKNKFKFPVFLDLAKNKGMSKAIINVDKEKMEVLLDDSALIGVQQRRELGVQQRSRELYKFSDPKLYVKAFEKELKVDIFTQHGRFGVLFDANECDGHSKWRSFVALLFFYISLEYPRSRKEPGQVEIVRRDGYSECLVSPSCPLIVPVPPVHYKITRQDARMILKKYSVQDGWYMFSTFDTPPKKDDNLTNGVISMSYCMDEKIIHITVNFSQDLGFGPTTYRIEEFRGKKFCSLYELACHISINNRQLHTFLTEKMIEDVSVPENVIFPVHCIDKSKDPDNPDIGMFYSAYEDKKHCVRVTNLPNDFRHAKLRVNELESLVRELCDFDSIHSNILRIFGICAVEKPVNIKLINEDFGVCLHDYLSENCDIDYHELLNMGYHISKGIQGLHSRRIIHGFPVLHNCLIDPSSGVVKIGDVGILLICITTHQLDGVTLEKEELPFECETVCAAPRFHPARWLPKETLFNHEFTEKSDRWCFGHVLWQMFNGTSLPMSHLRDVELIDQLKQEKESWFQPLLEVKHPNKVLEMMLEKTIKYCLETDCIDNVVQLLDPNQPEAVSCYTFANVQNSACDIDAINIQIANVNGEIRFKNLNNINKNDLNCHKLQGVDTKTMNLGNLYNPLNTLNLQSPPNLYNPLNNMNIRNEDEDEFSGGSQVYYEPLSDVIKSINTIDPSDITMTETIIGSGNFASVKKGILKNDNNPEGIEVAIKTYHPDIKVADIEKEIDAMTQLKHRFIIPLRGIYRGDGLWLIMNFYKFGSLDKYIEQNSDILISRLALFANQIAEGMQFLSNENYIHRDLSTRNVLVQNKYKVRIADLGLSRSVEKQYYKHKTGLIPYLWYPPEFFETHTYGKSLDVWSYGITCYEIFNNAEVPYLNCSPPITDIKLLKDYFDSGKRLAVPEKASPVYHIVISNCWKDKSSRWTFNDIVHYINNNGD